MFYNDSTNYSNMLNWIKKARTLIPADLAVVLDFTTLTGLRAEEAIYSIQKLQDPKVSTVYVNNDKNTLEHFRFPELFIRRTKKCYISIITDDILRLAKQARSETCYRTLQYHLHDKKLGAHVKYCRKIFGTYLRTKGIEAEFIDILEGRKPKSVFAKHYYRPDWKEHTEQIRLLLKQLYQEITGNKSSLQKQDEPLEKKSQHLEQKRSHAVPVQPYPNLPYYLPPGAV